MQRLECLALVTCIFVEFWLVVMLLTGIMIGLWLRFMSRDSSQDSLKPRGAVQFSLRWNLPWPSSLTWLSNNSLKLYLLCPYLAWRLLILANISTWPVEYCSITSLTSYGLLASCTTRKYKKDDKKSWSIFQLSVQSNRGLPLPWISLLQPWALGFEWDEWPTFEHLSTCGKKEINFKAEIEDLWRKQVLLGYELTKLTNPI